MGSKHRVRQVAIGLAAWALMMACTIADIVGDLLGSAGSTLP
jgi:hypothetical protein